MTSEKQNFWRTAASLAIILLILVPFIRAQQVSCDRPDVLNEVVDRFHATNVSMVQALLQLGQQRNICFGIEYVDKASLLNPISLDLHNLKVADIISAILSHGHGYTCKAREGVIEINNAKLPRFKQNLFDRILPEFKTQRTSVVGASAALEIRLFFALNPRAQGIAGDYPGGDPTDLVGPFDVHNKTLKQILDTIVAHSNGASWVANANGPELKNLPPSGLWRIMEYDSPIASYASLLKGIAESLAY